MVQELSTSLSPLEVWRKYIRLLQSSSSSLLGGVDPLDLPLDRQTSLNSIRVSCCTPPPLPLRLIWSFQSLLYRQVLNVVDPRHVSRVLPMIISIYFHTFLLDFAPQTHFLAFMPEMALSGCCCSSLFSLCHNIKGKQTLKKTKKNNPIPMRLLVHTEYFDLDS